MQQELLIEKVRHYEFLYNVHSAQYRDQNMRHEAWEEIGRDLKLTASQAKNMWSKLRNCFSNALKRRNAKKSGQAAKKKYIPWKYEKQMGFLQSYTDTRQTLSNLSQSDTQLTEQQSQMTEGDIDDEQDPDVEGAEDNGTETDTGEHTPVSSPSTSNAEMQSKIHQQRPLPKKRNNPAEEMIAIMKKQSELRIQKASEKANNNKLLNNLNETDMFYLSMSKTIQKLPLADQIHLRMEFCNLVSEAELRQLNSVQPASTQPAISQPTISQPTTSQPASPEAASAQHTSMTHTPVYHTLTPVDPNSCCQSQTLAQIPNESNFNEENYFSIYSQPAWR